MNRREFGKLAGLSAAGMALAGKAMAKKKLPDYMPIVQGRIDAGYVSHYIERELTEPVMLCDDQGYLNPQAVGWSRVPLVTANLKGHWPRKKRWNFWNWISPDFSFSLTCSDIDFGAFCAANLIDFKTKKTASAISIRRGGSIDMPEQVERTIHYETGSMQYHMINEGGDIRVSFSCKNMKGKPAKAEFTIIKPKGHETLNIVAPWSNQRFQMNSKHNTLPTRGYVEVAGKRYEMDPENCHAVQDFGRGMWPYVSFWNWAVATGKQDGDLIGVNMGAKWTTGTGANENGICYNGRLYKVMEDLVWEYDNNDWMKPWHIRTGYSDMIDLTLTPIYPQKTNLSLGVIRTGGNNSFGHWNGTLKFDGKTIKVNNMIGWAEEFEHRW